ncbi:MAG: DUF3791 domain-containing protein [Bacteroidia bacterium]|nr:DUF3791 domain-containing protein [Bacteroidia bacterium]
MSKKERENRIEYYYCCLGAFASRHCISNAEAYRYLKTFKGLDFIDRFYEVEHTQSIEDAVEDMSIVCQKNGGTLSRLFITAQTGE